MKLRHGHHYHPQYLSNMYTRFPAKILSHFVNFQTASTVKSLPKIAITGKLLIFCIVMNIIIFIIIIIYFQDIFKFTKHKSVRLTDSSTPGQNR